MKKKKIGEDGEEYFIYSEPYFRCKDFTITNSNVITDALDRAAEEIKNIIAGWLSEGSGCVIDEILQHYVKIVKYVPLRGNSYIQLPKELRNSMKGLINLKNEYDKCAIWCLVRHLNPRKIHPERITGSDREFLKGLDLKYITYPVTINQIPQIERQNNININVFGYDKNSIFPIYVSGSGANHRSKDQKNPDHMELLYIEEKEGGGEKQHCNCGQTILNSTDAFELMYTLIRRLKLKDKRTESYNMNKKQNCTNCQRNTANMKRR